MKPAGHKVPNRGAGFARKGILPLLVDAEMAFTIREDLEYQRSRDREEKGPLIATIRHMVRLVATIGPLIAYAMFRRLRHDRQFP